MSIARIKLIDHVRRALCGLTVMLLFTTVSAAADSETEPLERILETARTFLIDALGTDGRTETRIEIGRLDNRLRLNRCAHPPTAQLAPGARAENSTTVNVRCSEPAPWSIFVPVRVERYAEVVVAARAISRQQVIQPGDVRLERQETSQLATGYIDDLAVRDRPPGTARADTRSGRERQSRCPATTDQARSAGHAVFRQTRTERAHDRRGTGRWRSGTADPRPQPFVQAHRGRLCGTQRRGARDLLILRTIRPAIRAMNPCYSFWRAGR